MSYKKQAFTLIELLIVVAIIGILAAIAVPNFLNARIKAGLARAQSDMVALSKALAMYRLDRNAFPYFYLARWEADGGFPVKEYGSWEKNRYELSVLTSPAAYMAAIPQDVFSPGMMGARTDNEAVASMTGEWPYDYTSFEAFRVVNYDMTQKNYTLKSRGPDRYYNSSRVYYEISNGLYSKGDLTYLDGSEHRGG